MTVVSCSKPDSSPTSRRQYLINLDSPHPVAGKPILFRGLSSRRSWYWPCRPSPCINPFCLRPPPAATYDTGNHIPRQSLPLGPVIPYGLSARQALLQPPLRRHSLRPTRFRCQPRLLRSSPRPRSALGKVQRLMAASPAGTGISGVRPSHREPVRDITDYGTCECWESGAH